MDRLPAIHQQYALYRGVKPLRIDHFNCFSPDVDESVTFYNEIGFRVTEYTEDAETGKLWAAWTPARVGCTISRSRTVTGRGFITRLSGCRHRSTSSICAT